MLYVFCATWSGGDDGCLPVVWDSLFRLPRLKRLHLDWHMNPLAFPTTQESPLHALHNLTHLSIVPQNHSIQLDFLRRFEALTYLVIFNPGLGYTRDSIMSFEVGLPQLSVLLLIFTADKRDKSLWMFDQSKKIVTLDRVHYPLDEEYEKELNGGNSIWRDGEEALAK
ncbi:hypothetical protein DL96DRAFT_1644575, partial [Flagelloscypha sp. PMI_526]